MCEEKKYNDVDCKECKVNVKLRIFRDITKARVSFVERGISEARTADIELPESKNGDEGNGAEREQYGFDSSAFSNFDMTDGFADFGTGFDFPKIGSKSEEAVTKKTEPEVTSKSTEEKIVPKREIPPYSAALKEHTYRLKGYKVPKKASYV